MFAAHATGTDPRDFGGTDLVKQLNATGPAPRTATAQSGASGESGTSSESAEDDDSGSGNVWWIVGVGLAAGAGIGFLLSGRNKRRQP